MNKPMWVAGVLCAWLAACGGKENAGTKDPRNTGGAGGAGEGVTGAGPSAGRSGNNPGVTGGMTGGGTGGIVDPVDSGPTVPSSWLLLTIGAIARGNGLYVAVGSDVEGRDDSQAKNVIYTSPDGFAWTRSPVAPPAPFSDVAFGNGAFVGVDLQESGIRVYRSEDGETWSLVESQPAAGNALSVPSDLIAFGNGTFVVVARDRVLTSSDGKDWQSTPHEPVDGVVFGAGRFAVWHSVEFASSKNGVDWVASEPIPSDTLGWNRARLFGSDAGFQGILGAYCCFGELPPGFVPVHSDDGSVWKLGTGRASVPVAQEPGACITFQQEGVSGSLPHAYTTFAVGPSCSEAKPIVADNDYGFYPQLALRDGPAYLVAGQPGIYSSKDGVHYEPTLIHAEPVY